uniref:MULE transposase domain-containing protein n=1 Tax=Meloidogyne javanica TaxID=6303 RepID=A0A915MIV5_MELJA
MKYESLQMIFSQIDAALNAEDTSDNSNQEEIVVSKDDSASRKDTGADVKAQIGAMLSNEGCPVTVEIISVRHGDNVDVEHDYGDERDDELTFDASHEGAEYEAVRTSTSRNKPIIHHNNIPYLFHQLSKNGLVKFWRCESFSGPEIKCKARIHTDLDDVVIKEIGSHSCVKGKRDAAKFGTPKDEGTSVDRTLRSATKPKKRSRPKANLPPSGPDDVRGLDIPNGYKIYVRPKEGGAEGEVEEEQFLLADSGVYEENGDQRILIFACASTTGWIDQVQQIFVDGTIPVAPVLFDQLYLIMARRGAWVFPICYCLLTCRTQKSYERMLDLIQKRWPTFSPRSASIDFEQGFFNAMRAKHPQCNLHFSFFHLSQNLKKQMGEQGLIQLYNTDAVFAESARMIICLAFLPISDLAAALTVLEACLPNQLQQVFDWFLVNFSGRPRFDGTLSQPLYSPNQWNAYQRTLDGIDRIEYYVEDIIRKEQKRTDDEITQFIGGLDPPKKGRRQLAAEAKILSLVQQYVPIVDHMYANQIQDPNRIIDFLAQISRNCEAEH